LKKNFIVTASSFVILFVACFIYNYNRQKSTGISKLKEKHASFLANSPFKDTKKLSRDERKTLGLPPNAYYEQMWELTMNPSTGRPMPERILELQSKLRENRNLARGVGGDSNDPWINRGPNNQGGRTRGVLFDPNDVGNADPNEDYNRVFAGGVSGGLWINEDITDENQSWTLVPGIQANISVTVIVADPNDSNIFYIGSGESYVSGAAVGRGIWKSEDAGATWNLIFGDGVTSITNNNQFVNGIFYVNDLVIRDNNGISEIYASVASAFYGSASAPNNFSGLDTMGLYKSVDGGDNWSRFDITHSSGIFKNPNDIELDINNNIWLTTTRTIGLNSQGGDIYKSTDGIDFNLVTKIPGNVRRTELEVSSLDPDKLWVAVNRFNPDAGKFEADLFLTNDAFNSIIQMDEPDDIDQDISATDYTRSQAFYDLPIEVDANDKLYIGGIDLFISTDDGANWEQISKWSDNNDLANLEVPLVHADQHGIFFRPNSNDVQAVFANDGGVYYSNDVGNLAGNPDGIEARHKDYITTQFYYGSISPVDIEDGDELAGGTQDNGTQLLLDGNPGPNAFSDPYGGDGAFTEFDDSGSYLIQSYTGNTHSYVNFPELTNFSFLTEADGGSFINSAVLDKNLDVFYSNATTTIDDETVRAIERVSNFVSDDFVPTERDILTNPLLNSNTVAMTVSPFTTGSTSLFLGLANGKLLKVNSANLDNAQWSDISGADFLGSISDIEFGQNESEIFVTMHNYGVISVWFTDDGGTNWNNIEGDLPELPVKCILQNPLIPNELIIGTELGVWYTPDYTLENPSWIQTYNGMSDVTVLDLDVRESDNTILATTHGRGLFTSQFTAASLSLMENNFKEDVISLFPTVSEGNFTLKSTKPLANAKFELFDISGKSIYNEKLELNNTGSNISINAQPGLYLAIISEGSFSETKKIIIK